MTNTLESLARGCRQLLAASNTPAARVQIAALLSSALRDPEFLRALFAGSVSERELLYQDPDLDFCIVAHEYRVAKEGHPHDHGPSWAIYGQASGETLMSDFVVLQPAGPHGAGKVRRTSSYRLTPGDVHLYNEGDVHAPSRTGPTRLVRIEGMDLAKVARSKYDVIAD